MMLDLEVYNQALASLGGEPVPEDEFLVADPARDLRPEATIPDPVYAEPPAAPAPPRAAGVDGVIGEMERDASASGQMAQLEADEASYSADVALGERRAAIESRGRAQLQASQRSAELLNERNAKIEKELAGRAESQAAADARRERFFADYESAKSERDALPPVAEKRDTFTIIMGALAIIGGGIADSLSHRGGGQGVGGLQSALGVINQSIQRDLEEQRAAHEAADAKVDRAKDRISIFDKIAASEEAGSLAREAAITQDYAGRLQAVAAENEGTVLAANALEMSSALEQQAEEKKAAAADMEAQRELERSEKLRLTRAQMQEKKAQAAAAARARANDPERALKIQKMALENKKLASELAKQGQPDLEQELDDMSEGEAKIYRGALGLTDARKRLTALVSGKQALPAGSRGITGMITPSAWQSKEARMYKQDLEQIVDVPLRDKSGAVISDPEIERDLSDALSGNKELALQALKNVLARYDARVVGIGLNPYTGEFVGKRAARKLLEKNVTTFKPDAAKGASGDF